MIKIQPAQQIAACSSGGGRYRTDVGKGPGFLPAGAVDGRAIFGAEAMGFLLSLRHAVYNLCGRIAHRKSVSSFLDVTALVTGTIETRRLCGG